MDTRIHRHSTADRLAGVDVLRGLAAVYVMLFHYTYRFAVRHPELPAPVVWFPRGPLAVALFFMISGFVISLTAERSRSALDFVIGRVTRIHPTLAAAVLVTSSFCALMGHPITSPWRTLANTTGIHHLFGIRHVDYSYWSLEVELLFYAAVAALLVTRAFPRLPWVLLGWLALSIVVATIDQAAPHSLPELLSRLLMILQHVAYFALGMVLYRWWRHGSLAPIDVTLLALVAARVALYRDGVTAVATLCFVAVFVHILRGGLRVLETRPLLFLGAISYPLYLLHNAIGRWVIHDLVVLGVNIHVAIAVAVAGSIGLASLLTFWYERPVMALLRRRWREARSERPAAAVVAGD